jgi:hypothetical protein
MAKRSTATGAPDLTVRERVLLFCAASNTDWEHAGIPGAERRHKLCDQPVLKPIQCAGFRALMNQLLEATQMPSERW